MKGIRIAVAAGSALLVSSHALAYVTLIEGFDSFSLGGLDGQAGWVGSKAGGAGAIKPEVVDFQGMRTVRMFVGDDQGDESTMQRSFDGGLDLIKDGWKQTRVSYKIYRPSPALGSFAQNLYWWFTGNNPDYGTQWDMGSPNSSQTTPVGTFAGSGHAATVFDAWADLTYEYDFTAKTFSSWYNGVQLDNNAAMNQTAIDGFKEMNGYYISLKHESASGTGRDLAYVAGLKVEAVPEPATMIALGLGVAALLRRRRTV